MKKRTILLSLSMFTLLSCSSRPDADVRNKYASEADCLKDNPKTEIAKNISDFDASKLCEKVTYNGETYYLGPAYPSKYYGGGGNNALGFIGGYWIGSAIANSMGVVHRSGESFTHSRIASGGGINSTIGKAGSGSSVSRGGFGSRDTALFGG